MLPVLMFHSISDTPESGVNPYYRVCTSPARFREQMQWLKDNGWQGVTLEAGLAWLDSTKQKAESGNLKSSTGRFGLQPSAFAFRPVVLTFDDGFRDFYTTARPLLREFGFTATMYLPTAFIGDSRRPFTPSPRQGLETLGKRRKQFAGGEGPLKAERAGASESLGRGEVSPSSIFHPPSPVRGRDCLTWPEVRELHRAGIEFGSHTVTHPKLTELTWPEIQSELSDSKTEIEQQLGEPVKAFAYPYAFPQTAGDFVSRFKDVLSACAYETNVTTQIGRVRPGQDTLQLQRLPINQDDDLPLLAAKLAGAYDWVGRVQSLSKTLRRGRNTVVGNSTSGPPVLIPMVAAKEASDNGRDFQAKVNSPPRGDG